MQVSKKRTRTRKQALTSPVASKLEGHGIVTMADLDRWIAQRPRVIDRGPHKGKREFMSRYQALRTIVGEDAAIVMLNSLAIAECT